MDDFDLEIKREFINEALVNLEEAEGSFMELETAADPRALLDKIFRLAHNLKGGARAVGFGEVAEFTHRLEDLVQKIQKGTVALSADVVTVLLRANDRLVEMLTALKGDLNAVFDNAALMQQMEDCAAGKAAAEVPPAAAFFADEPKSEPADTPAVALASVPVTAPPAGDDEIVRVNMSRIDRLNDYVGELIVLQSMIQQQAAAAADPALQTSIRQMTKLAKDIQGLSMGMRMLPVKPLVQKLQRVVRDTAKTLGKPVAFEVAGDGMDIDKSVLDRLADPLIHILRNAVDHGLETPEARAEAGKPEQGRVLLSFSHQGNYLIIDVRDDGRGIDTGVIRQKAVEKGLVNANANLGDKQLLHLIFHPGFSTKSVTSEISGRGVGMDVVKTNIEKVGGQVDVCTEIGKGSIFRMQIPLSLAVIEGLVVVSAKDRYVVPLSQVQETVNLKAQNIHPDKLGIGSCFDLRGAVVPLVGIDEALGAGPTRIEEGDTGLIINVGQQPVGLVVKDILRSQQIVIKPLGNGLVAQRGWIGSCILGDGLPTLILSPADLLESRLMGGAA